MLYRKPWKLIMYSPTNNTTDESKAGDAYIITMSHLYYESGKTAIGNNSRTETKSLGIPSLCHSILKVYANFTDFTRAFFNNIQKLGRKTATG